MYHRPLFKRWPRRRSFDTGGQMNSSLRLILFIAAAIFVLIIISASIYLKNTAAQIAAANARDVVTEKINDAVIETLRAGEYTADSFVSFQKSDTGDITAISSNMPQINELSSAILDNLLGATKDNTITIHVPFGNLTGASLLMGRGPKLPLRILVLSSSRVEFNNGVVTAGINQTKHQLDLCVTVDMELLIPWGSERMEVSSDVLIADTVIVGKVPETYLNMQEKG